MDVLAVLGKSENSTVARCSHSLFTKISLILHTTQDY